MPNRSVTEEYTMIIRKVQELETCVTAYNPEILLELEFSHFDDNHPDIIILNLTIYNQRLEKLSNASVEERGYKRIKPVEIALSKVMLLEESVDFIYDFLEPDLDGICDAYSL